MPIQASLGFAGMLLMYLTRQRFTPGQTLGLAGLIFILILSFNMPVQIYYIMPGLLALTVGVAHMTGDARPAGKL